MLVIKINLYKRQVSTDSPISVCNLVPVYKESLRKVSDDDLDDASKTTCNLCHHHVLLPRNAVCNTSRS